MARCRPERGRLLHREPEQPHRHDDAQGGHPVAAEEQARRIRSLIVDEAYHHFSNDESVIDQVAADKDIIVLRTFSKIYGMAGVRAGFAIARPDLLEKFQTISPDIRLRSVASVSLLAAAAAGASLRDPNLVPTRRKINTDVPHRNPRIPRQEGLY